MTSAQQDAFNTLLTQLARVIDELEMLVSPLNNTQSQTEPHPATLIKDELRKSATTNDSYDRSLSPDKRVAKRLEPQQVTLDPIQMNWHYLLIDLKSVVLPEFYVVFNDPTTTATGRRQLYDLTQAIFFTLQRYLDASLVAHVKAKSNPHYPLQMERDPDSYVTGQGKGAKVALQLHELAQFIAIDAIFYIARFEPYYAVLVELDTLERFLQRHSQQELINQIEQWQRARFAAFSIINPKAVTHQSDVVNTQIDHALAQWFKREINSSHASSPIATRPQQAQGLIARPQQFQTGVTLSVIGLVIVILGLNVPSLGLLSLLGAVFAFTGIKHIVPSFNFEGERKQISSLTTKVMLVSFFVMIMGTPLTPVAFMALAIALSMKVYNHNQRLSHSHSVPALSDKSPQMLGEIEATRIEPATSDPVTLTFERHAHHLGMLLSDGPSERLRHLITATNELIDNQNYLQTAYPYLATRVQELIKDLRDNTIIRLDELASRFVKDNQISAEVRALFARQHEARIDALIVLNLKQVKDLNETILEKQMAVFSDVGSDQERQFRDAVMELKILLRWLIAQQPDELQASSHQVILDNLESSTLKDMQAVFFDNNTTSEQRQALLDQVRTLIGHFKQQSPYTLDVNSGHVDSAAQEAKIDTLLKLSHPKDSQQANAAVDRTEEQAKAQQFVDFNKAYVAELIKYWH
ncbi:hypothetical protein [Psychrobacter pygoscelis]|uniref:hypothetical protein n=1 Tax=Psychrobacter pygoscelis TaxID=2488563 RepID=UPI00103B9206|nr:hypothetical protein [Psychrobacter pygoscelis]